jgi:hypothetical protein
MLLGKAPQRTATVIPSEVRARRGGQVEGPRESNQHRCPGNALSRRCIELDSYAGEIQLKDTQSARNRNTFHKTGRTSPKHAREKALQLYRYDSTIGILPRHAGTGRLFVASSVAPKPLPRQAGAGRMTGLNGVLFPVDNFSAKALLCHTNLNNPGLHFQIQRTFFS